MSTIRNQHLTLKQRKVQFGCFVALNLVAGVGGATSGFLLLLLSSPRDLYIWVWSLLFFFPVGLLNLHGLINRFVRPPKFLIESDSSLFYGVVVILCNFVLLVAGIALVITQTTIPLGTLMILCSILFPLLALFQWRKGAMKALK